MTISPRKNGSRGRKCSSTTSDSPAPSLDRQLAQASPALFALLTSEGRWKLARHLRYLDQVLMSALREAARGELEGLVVAMPPQHGKSELISKYLPAWYLGTHPDRRVILCGYEADFATQ